MEGMNERIIFFILQFVFDGVTGLGHFILSSFNLNGPLTASTKLSPGTQEAPREHPGRTQKAPSRHARGTKEASRAARRLQEALEAKSKLALN